MPERHRARVQGIAPVAQSLCIAMEIRAMRYFVEVVQAGTFSAASARLHVAQPAISRQVQSLEQEFGQPLLLRSPQGPKLTPVGRIFYERARALVESFDELAADIRAVGSDNERRVRIGVPPTCAADQGVDLWTTISARMPNRRVEIIEGLSRFLPELLRRGDVDVVLSLHCSTDLDIEYRLVEREEMVLLMPLGHPLARVETTISLADIAQVPLILSAGFETVLRDFAQQFGEKICCNVKIDSIAATCRIAISRGLATVLPVSVAQEQRRSGRMAFRKITPTPERTLYVATMRDQTLPGLGAAINNYLQTRHRLQPVQPTESI